MASSRGGSPQAKYQDTTLTSADKQQMEEVDLWAQTLLANDQKNRRLNKRAESPKGGAASPSSGRDATWTGLAGPGLAARGAHGFGSMGSKMNIRVAAGTVMMLMLVFFVLEASMSDDEGATGFRSHQAADVVQKLSQSELICGLIAVQTGSEQAARAAETGDDEDRALWDKYRSFPRLRLQQLAVNGGVAAAIVAGVPFESLRASCPDMLWPTFCGADAERVNLAASDPGLVVRQSVEKNPWCLSP
ncbi:hypothetical protein DIPPA_29026 [Diplonema papillatum]|nr:hypothetical protein DIPPA_29026 [Diplonema papillatum]|eukprot:gene8109-12470_t